MKKTYDRVVVLAWNFSRYTTNGNAVHAFTIKTETGLEISGKTAPNNGFAVALPREPGELVNVTIRTTRGYDVMTHADRV